MKRMYLTLAILLSLLLWAVTSFGQKNKTSDPAIDSMQKRMQLREEMHRRMMNKLLHGIGPDEDLFKDLEQMLEESMTDSLQGLDSLDSIGAVTSNYQTEWQEDKKGRTLIVTPQNPDQQLDINVQNDVITIKGKKEIKTPQGSSVSSFANSFSVPGDCDPGKVKIRQDAGRILIELPYLAVKEVTLPKKPERTPIKPTEGDVTI